MNDTIIILLKVCPFIFIAGFIDSIAGGGGLISLPAYLFAGLPVHNALATNKLSSTIGTLFSTARFIKSGSVNLVAAISSAIAALIGSYFGAMASLAIDEKFLKYLLVILLPIIAVFIFTNKNFGDEDTSSKFTKRVLILLAFVAGLVVGFYDGLFGPGTGTFLIIIFTKIIGFSLKTASGNAKIANLASNIGSVITFIVNGKVLFLIGLPAAIFGILGNWLGAGMALKGGTKVIKPVLIIVLVLLFSKVAIDLF